MFKGFYATCSPVSVTVNYRLCHDSATLPTAERERQTGRERDRAEGQRQIDRRRGTAGQGGWTVRETERGSGRDGRQRQREE